MVNCTSCGKPMEKIPNWMQAVKTEYVCNNCPNRQTKNIAFINLDPAIPAAAKLEVDEEELPDATNVEEKAKV